VGFAEAVVPSVDSWSKNVSEKMSKEKKERERKEEKRGAGVEARLVEVQRFLPT
jgi:hypothetical protein